MFKKLAFIGAGSMADAIITGMLSQGLCQPEHIHVTNKMNKKRLEEIKTKHHIEASHNKKAVIAQADAIVLAVKPKDIKEALVEMKHFISESQLVISVIAGVSSHFIMNEIGKQVPVIRAMPNTSATICNSATAIAAGKYANERHLQIARELFETIGTVTIVNENHLHAVTGLSGSGPAYIYYLVEAMEEAAVQSGLDSDVAQALVRQTLIGATEMLKTSKDSPALLRKKITSEGGTTQAGLEVLKHFKYQEGLIACVKRATARSVELGANYSAVEEV